MEVQERWGGVSLTLPPQPFNKLLQPPGEVQQQGAPEAGRDQRPQTSLCLGTGSGPLDSIL